MINYSDERQPQLFTINYRYVLNYNVASSYMSFLFAGGWRLLKPTLEVAQEGGGSPVSPLGRYEL